MKEYKWSNENDFIKQTLAISVKVRLILQLGWMSYKENSLGVKIAGAKNRKKMKALTAR